jgi:hypothetical protein
VPRNRNVTLTIPDELVRRARMVAAARETSLSALVASLLSQMVGDVDDYETVWANEETFMQSGALRVGEIAWTRDAMHTR